MKHCRITLCPNCEVWRLLGEKCPNCKLNHMSGVSYRFAIRSTDRPASIPTDAGCGGS